MNRRISLYIDGRLADIADDSLILFNYDQASLDNPTVVKNSFSRTIDLPGTPTNDDIFGHYFKLDRKTLGGGVIGSQFNALKRVPFIVYNEMGEVLERGYIRLNSIKRSSPHVHSYNVALFGGLGDFFYSLMYNADGTQKSLADVVFYLTTSVNPQTTNLTIDRNLITSHWANIKTAGHLGRILNFAPAYNGIPANFSANKMIIYGEQFVNVPVTAQDADGNTYSAREDANGAILVDLGESHTEWEVGDLRSYNQRPVVSLYEFLYALQRSVNTGEYTFRLDTRFFNGSNEWFNNGWITLPMLDRALYGKAITLADILRSTASPAEYLIGIAKTLGCVFSVDDATKTIILMARDDYYKDKMGDIIDLTRRINVRKDVDITPFIADTKYYLFQNEVNGELARAYENTYGRRFGSKLVDTDYDFEMKPNDVLDGNVFKGAVDALESSPYYFDNALAVTKMLEPNAFYLKFGKYGTIQYKLYREVPATDSMPAETKSIDVVATEWAEQKNEGFSMFQYWNAGYNGLDFMPKVQLHSEENKADSGENVLLIYNGSKSIPVLGLSPSSFRPNIYISDDTPEMMLLNNNTPCWLGAGLLAESHSTKLTSLPSFRRALVGNGIARVTYDFGDTREVYTKGEIYLQGENLFDKLWGAYIADRYSLDSKVLRCMVDLKGIQVSSNLLSRFFYYEGCIWSLNRIINHSFTTEDLTECEFIKVDNIASYTSGQNYRVPDAPTYSLRVEPASLSFAQGGETKGISIYANQRWSITTKPSWLTVEQTSGEGNATVSVTSSANSGAMRNATLAVVGANGDVAEIALAQEGTIATFSINGESGGRYPVSGSDIVLYNDRVKVLSITSSYPFVLGDPSGALQDGTMTSYPAGSYNINLPFKVNSGTSSQFGYLTFSINGNIVAYYHYERRPQAAGFSYEIGLSQEQIEFSASGGSQSITVEGKTLIDGVVQSTVQLAPGDLTIEGRNVSGAFIRNELLFTASNLGTSLREAKSDLYTLRWNAHPEAVKNLTVYQQANVVTRDVVTYDNYVAAIQLTEWANSGTSVASSGGDDALIYLSESSRRRVSTKTYTSGSTAPTYTTETWIPELAVSGAGLSLDEVSTGTYQLAWEANSGQSSRSGTINALNGSAVVSTREVTQSGASAVITTALVLSSTGYTFPASGGEQTITVYGVTYENGIEVSRVTLPVDELTINKGSGDIAGQFTRNGLTFIAEDLQTNLRPSRTAIYTFSWQGATATYTMSQLINRKEDESVMDTDFHASVSLNNWSGSHTQTASADGDTTTFSVSGGFTRTRTQIYSSGATKVDASEQTWVIADNEIAVAGTGLTRNGNTLTWEQNTEITDRSGSIIISHNSAEILDYALVQAGIVLTNYGVFIIVDGMTQERIFGASAIISGTQIEYTSDEDGFIMIPNAVLQRYMNESITFSMVGYFSVLIPRIGQYAGKTKIIEL